MSTLRMPAAHRPPTPSRAGFVGAALLAAACGAPTSPADRARLTLDVAPAAGAPAGAARVRLTLRHDGGPAVALTGCPAPPAVRIERDTAGAWRDAGSSGILCQAIYRASTVALSAGGTLEAVLTLPPGRYRFVVPVGPDVGAPERALRSGAVALP